MALGDHTITLPSRGAFYGGKIPDGKVEVKRLSAYDLALLNTTGGDSTDRINKLVEHVCTLPNGFKQADLLATDRLYIMVAARCFSFGGQHRVDYVCSACGARQDTVVDVIRDLNDKPMAEDAIEPFEVALKDAGKTVAMRFQRGYDEAAVVKFTKKLAASRGDVADLSDLHRLAHCLVKIDGNDPGDIMKREAFILELSARDAARIQDTMDRLEPGIDMAVTVTCEKCGNVEKVRLPMSLDFFRPPADHD